MSTHVAWGSIELLHNVVRNAYPPPRARPAVPGRALPGQGQAPRLELRRPGPPTAVRPEPDLDARRPRPTTRASPPGSTTHAALLRLARRAAVVVFGEWCGPGVEKGMAISQVSVEAVRRVRRPGRRARSVRARRDRALVSAARRPADLHVLPWEADVHRIDYGSREPLDASPRRSTCAWTPSSARTRGSSTTFGISGLGEGLVFYPVTVDGAPAKADPESLAP